MKKKADSDAMDALILVWTLLFISIIWIVWAFVAGEQPTRNTCIVGSRWYGNCEIEWEYEWTKMIKCLVANGKVSNVYTLYTTWDCYPNTNTGKIQLYNEHWIKR